jgi:hypothetical protein
MTWEQIESYIKDVDAHNEKLLRVRRNMRNDDIQVKEAEKLNTLAILDFHEKLTKFLQYCNIKILTKAERKLESKIEKILKSMVIVQNKINAKTDQEDIVKAIASIKEEIGDDLENVISRKIA